AAPTTPGPLNGVAGFYPISAVQAPVLTHNALYRYHIFNSPRPWIFSQWYLAPAVRPVDMEKTIVLLGCMGGAGLALLLLGIVFDPKSLSHGLSVRAPSPRN